MPFQRSKQGRGLKGRGLLVPVAWFVSLVLIGGIAFWCARLVFQPPEVSLEPTTVTKVTVTEATVGRTVDYAAYAVWAMSPVGVGLGEGVVTSIDIAPGVEATVGTVLYTLNLRPVVIAAGAVPAFRDLAAGAAGADVTQLQRFLRDTGHLTAKVKEGTFDSATEVAVKRWQKSLGIAQDGIVLGADIVYVPTLPARFVLNDSMMVGAHILPGETVVNALFGQPDFTLTVNPEQAELISSGLLQVTIGDVTTDAIVVDNKGSETGDRNLTLATPDGAPLCRDRCLEVPLDRYQATYRATRVVVPEATGPAVPSAAVRTSGDGGAFVTGLDGNRIPVSVVAQGDGVTVLDGVAIGDVVQLFGGQK